MHLLNSLITPMSLPSPFHSVPLSHSPSTPLSLCVSVCTVTCCTYICACCVCIHLFVSVCECILAPRDVTVSNATTDGFTVRWRAPVVGVQPVDEFLIQAISQDTERVVESISLTVNVRKYQFICLQSNSTFTGDHFHPAKIFSTDCGGGSHTDNE